MGPQHPSHPYLSPPLLRELAGRWEARRAAEQGGAPVDPADPRRLVEVATRAADRRTSRLDDVLPPLPGSYVRARLPLLEQRVAVLRHLHDDAGGHPVVGYLGCVATARGPVCLAMVGSTHHRAGGDDLPVGAGTSTAWSALYDLVEQVVSDRPGTRVDPAAAERSRQDAAHHPRGYAEAALAAFQASRFTGPRTDADVLLRVHLAQEDVTVPVTDALGRHGYQRLHRVVIGTPVWIGAPGATGARGQVRAPVATGAADPAPGAAPGDLRRACDEEAWRLSRELLAAPAPARVTAERTAPPVLAPDASTPRAFAEVAAWYAERAERHGRRPVTALRPERAAPARWRRAARRGTATAPRSAERAAGWRPFATGHLLALPPAPGDRPARTGPAPVPGQRRDPDLREPDLREPDLRGLPACYLVCADGAVHPVDYASFHGPEADRLTQEWHWHEEDPVPDDADRTVRLARGADPGADPFADPVPLAPDAAVVEAALLQAALWAAGAITPDARTG
ncbi:hypothetical protein [Kineococcus gypseus]|uniref:hypothetical protein n=1 Tax=Kineococcus gypseus TaxID=1637102 RepID=UPI003D7C7309